MKPGRILTILLLFLVILGLFTVVIHNLLGSKPVGADFYTFWIAARSTFAEGQNPYSQEVTLESQVGIYGRPATPDQDQVAFAYPPYSLVALLPVAWLSYDWAASFWIALNVLLLISVLYLVFPNAPKWFHFTVLVIYPFSFGIILGNFAVLIGILLILFYGYFIARSNPSRGIQIAMGIGLAWMTCKPQFVWFFMVFIFLMALSKRWWPLILSFAASLVVFFGAFWLLIPNWIGQWLNRVQEYAGYVQSSPVLYNIISLILPAQLAWIVFFIILAACAVFSVYLLVRLLQGKVTPLTVLIWIGLMTYTFHLHGISYEQISFLVPLLLWNGANAKKPAWQWLVFWFVPLILSWVIFAFSKWVFWSADEWPVLYYAGFVLWYFFQQKKAGLPVFPSLNKKVANAS